MSMSDEHDEPHAPHAPHEQHDDHVHHPNRDQAVAAWQVHPDTVPQRAPHVVETEIDGNLLIAHPRSMRVVRFDPINALLWRSFGPGVTVQDLADDLVDALGVDPHAALDTLTFIVTDLARAGFLTEPADPPSVRTPRWWPIDPESEQGKRLGLDRMGADHRVVLDTGDGLLRLATTDLEISAWLRARFADAVVPSGDPHLQGEIEMLLGVTGQPPPNLRPRHRAADHYGNVWFSTFDRAEHAEALGRALRSRLDAARGGTWIRLAALAADDPAPGDRPTPVVLLHPWELPTLERLLPGLRRLDVRVIGTPLLRYDATTGVLEVPASPRFPRPDETLPAELLEPVALVSAATEEPLGRAEVAERFGHAALRFDQVHLDAVAHLVTTRPFRTIDGSGGLRSITEQLAALLHEA